MTRAIQMLTRKGGPTVLGRNPITRYLTAQLQHTLLALELPRLLTPELLVNKRKVYSFQLQDMDALCCYFLSLPLCVRTGQFARLLLSFEVVAFSQAPSPESNPSSLLPSLSWWVNTLPSKVDRFGRLATKRGQQFIRNHQEHNRRRKDREVRV